MNKIFGTKIQEHSLRFSATSTVSLLLFQRYKTISTNSTKIKKSKTFDINIKFSKFHRKHSQVIFHDPAIISLLFSHHLDRFYKEY